jgi:hypothetical protein
MSDESNEMEWQLRKLMEMAAGEPTRQITTEMVRRLARRRTVAAVAAAIAIVLIGGAGAAVAARTVGRQDLAAAGLPRGVPRFYFVGGWTNTGQSGDVIRATASGKVTATVRCPGTSSPSTIITSVVPVGPRTFFIMCQSRQKSRPSLGAAKSRNDRVSGSRIYGFGLTATGRISGYFPARGGALGALTSYGLTATPDGSLVALLVPPGSSGTSSPARILVINTRTGAHTWWLWQRQIVGKIYFSIGKASFTGDGKELAVLGETRCIKGKNTPRCHSTAGEEVRAFNIAGPGGHLGQGRILLRQSSIMPLALDYINDAVISLDGSTLTLTEVGSSRGIGSNFVEALQVSATNSKNRRVIFRMNTGNGFAYNCFSADPTRRYFILDAGPTSGTKNGWIDDGRLVPLKPTQGDNIRDEAW